MNKEILWNVVNSLLFGGAVLFGAFTTGEITKNSFIAAIAAAGIVAIKIFTDYWQKEQDEYCRNNTLFSIIN